MTWIYFRTISFTLNVVQYIDWYADGLHMTLRRSVCIRCKCTLIWYVEPGNDDSTRRHSHKRGLSMGIGSAPCFLLYSAHLVCARVARWARSGLHCTLNSATSVKSRTFWSIVFTIPIVISLLITCTTIGIILSNESLLNILNFAFLHIYPTRCCYLHCSTTLAEFSNVPMLTFVY